MNARLPIEWRNGLTVGTGIYAALEKTGWLLLLCFHSLLALARSCVIHAYAAINVKPQVGRRWG